MRKTFFLFIAIALFIGCNKGQEIPSANNKPGVSETVSTIQVSTGQNGNTVIEQTTTVQIAEENQTEEVLIETIVNEPETVVIQPADEIKVVQTADVIKELDLFIASLFVALQKEPLTIADIKSIRLQLKALMQLKLIPDQKLKVKELKKMLKEKAKKFKKDKKEKKEKEDKKK